MSSGGGSYGPEGVAAPPSSLDFFLPIVSEFFSNLPPSKIINAPQKFYPMAALLNKILSSATANEFIKLRHHSQFCHFTKADGMLQLQKYFFLAIINRNHNCEPYHCTCYIVALVGLISCKYLDLKYET